MGKDKIDINIVFNGLSGSGKSTTAGHLLYRLEGSDKSLIELIEKRIEKEDSDMSLKYALVLDHLRGQSERTHLKFETTKYYCTFTDKPVLIDFINADCAVLIIDSTTAGRLPDYYELIDELIMDSSVDSNAGRFKPDIDDLTCGVRPKQMICCFNKMDATTPKYSKHRYHEVCEVVASYLEDVGIMRQIDPIKITFVPISGFEGDNLIERSTNLDWYKGPTLLEALDQINEPTSDYMNLSPMPEENLIYDEEPSPKLGGWSSESPKESTGLGKLYWGSPDLKLKESPMPSEENLDDGKSTGLGKLYWDSPDLKLKESPMPSEEEAPAEGEESPEYSKKLAEETHKDAEKAAFDEAEKKREKEESKDAPAESDVRISRISLYQPLCFYLQAEEEAEDDDNEADDSKVI